MADIIDEANRAETAQGRNLGGSNESPTNSFTIGNSHPPGVRNSHARQPRTSGDADEQTPLFLSPGDPEVTPYSVYIVRIIHRVLAVLGVLSFIWFLMLLIDSFVSFGMVDTKGSGFLELVFTLISLVSLSLSLLFFTSPSTADRVIGYSTCAFLFLDLVLILFVPALNHRNGGVVGVVTVLGSLAVIFLATVADHIVEAGKAHEEQRLTGRVEERRTLGKWLSVATSIFCRTVLYIIVVLISFNLILETYDSWTVKPNGELVSVGQGVGKYKVHLYCTDTDRDAKDRKTIVVEGGETSSSDTASWILDLYHLNKVDRVCYWDRPGIGLSDNAPSPQSIGLTADALGEALAEYFDLETTPLVLVSHGVGGLYSRVFASRHSAQVKCLLLVDTLHEELFYRRNTQWKGFKLFVGGVWSTLGLDNLGGLIFYGQGPWSRAYGPAQHHQARYYKALLQEQIGARGLSRNEILAANALLPKDTAVAVVTSDDMIAENKEWSELQRRLTKLSDYNLAWKILDGPHDVWRNTKSRKELQKLLLDLTEYV